jgi:hypothetical protein
VTIGLLTNKAKAHSFYSELAADGGEKGFKVGSGQFASFTVCHSFGIIKSTETGCHCCQSHHWKLLQNAQHDPRQWLISKAGF